MKTPEFVYAIMDKGEVVGLCTYAKDAAKEIKNGFDVVKMGWQEGHEKHLGFFYKMHPELEK